MHPVLLTTPYFTLYTFGVLLAAAYLSALAWVGRSAPRAGLDPEALTSLGVWAIVGALLGAKALLVLRSAGELLGGAAGASVERAARERGGLLGGVHGRVDRVGFLLPAPPAHAGVARRRRLRARHCARTGDRPDRMLHGGRRLRPADEPA